MLACPGAAAIPDPFDSPGRGFSRYHRTDPTRFNAPSTSALAVPGVL